MTATAHSAPVRVALGVAALAVTFGAMAGCSHGTGTGATAAAPAGGGATIVTTPATTPEAPVPTAGSGCGADCVTAEDGMTYRVTAVRRFTDPTGEALVAVAFQITNTSSDGHDFDPFGGGFGATLTANPDVQYSDFRGAARSGDARCYTGTILDDGPANGPEKITVAPGRTVAMPRDLCFLAPDGQLLAAVAFADDDVSANAVIAFDPPR